MIYINFSIRLFFCIFAYYLKLDIAETNYTELKGNYWTSLKEKGLPNYLKLNGELIKIIGEIYRPQKGKGTNKQCYYVLESGRQKHSSLFSKLNKTDIRDLKLKEILND